MKCPYKNPTISECENCHYPDCIRESKQDTNEQAAEWIRKNPEKRAKIRSTYYQRHKEKEKAYQKARYEKIKHTPEYREMKNAYMRKYWARKKAERVS